MSTENIAEGIRNRSSVLIFAGERLIHKAATGHAAGIKRKGIIIASSTSDGTRNTRSVIPV